MMADEQLRTIALFFLLAIKDEDTALQAAHKAVASLKASGHFSSSIERGAPETIRLLGRFAAQARRGQSLADATYAVNSDSKEMGGLQFEHPFDLSVWREFQKHADESELMAVIFAKILGFPEESIAKGLGVSLGTVRYRIGKGMRQLGVYTPSAEV